MIVLIAGLLLFFALQSSALLPPRLLVQWPRPFAMLTPAVRVVGALLAVGLIAHGYVLARMSPAVVYLPPTWGKRATDALMLPVFPLLFATFLPCRLRDALKYPELVAVTVWATAHLLANGMLADILLFGSFLVWGVVSLVSFRRRTRQMPSAAPSPYNDLVAVVAGSTTYLVLVAYLHYRLIGVSPI